MPHLTKLPVKKLSYPVSLERPVQHLHADKVTHMPVALVYLPSCYLSIMLVTVRREDHETCVIFQSCIFMLTASGKYMYSQLLVDCKIIMVLDTEKEKLAEKVTN